MTTYHLELAKQDAPRVWVIVPLFNRVENIPRLLDQLRAQTFHDFKLVLVDHGLRKVDRTTLPDFVIYLESTPDKWWSGAMNVGMRHVMNHEAPKDIDFIVFQNDDVIFQPDMLENLVRFSQQENAVIGPVTLQIDNNQIVDANNFMNKVRGIHNCPYRGQDFGDIKEDFLESDIQKGRGVIYPVPVVRKIGLLTEKLKCRADPEYGWRAKKHGYRLLIARQIIVRTELDTQKKITEVHNPKGVYEILFNPHSYWNLPDSTIYFFLCFNVFLATYCTLIFAAQTLLVALREVFRNRR